MSSLVQIDGFDNQRLLRNLTSDETEVLDSLNCGHYYCLLWACLRYRLALQKKRCNYCNLEVSCSYWAKHLRTQRHISKESAHVRGTISDDDEDFQLASPTPIPGLVWDLRRLGLRVQLQDSQVPEVRRLNGIRPVLIFL